MNRQQAEHILDAYISLECYGGDDNAKAALREVILDVMTEYKPSTITVPNITYPHITPNYGNTIATCGDDA